MSKTTFHKSKSLPEKILVEGEQSTGKEISFLFEMNEHHYNHDLLKGLYIYLTTPEFIESSSTYKAVKAREFKRFFSFCYHVIEKTNEIPLTILGDYFIYLKETSKMKTSSSFRIKLGYITWGINSILNSKLEVYNDVDLVLLYRYLEHSPDIKAEERVDSRPKKSLSDLFKNSPYNDTQFIESLRLSCAWLLEKCEFHRSILLQDSSIKRVLEKIISRNAVNSKPYSRFIYTSNKINSKEVGIEYGQLIISIINSDNTLLIERLFFENPPVENSVDFSNDGYTKDEMKSWIRRWLGTGKHKCPKNSVRKSFVYQPLIRKKTGSYEQYFSGTRNITYSSLIKPIDEEIFIMQCFMSSERTQSSGLKNHKVTDFVFNETGVQYDFSKDRRGKVSPTPIYSPKTTPYEVYKYWKELILNSNQYTNQGNMTLPYNRSELSKGYLSTRNKDYSLLLLLSDQNSHLSRQIKQDIGKASAPLIWLTRKIIENNDTVFAQEQKYAAAKRQGENTERSNVVQLSIVGFAPNPIALSAQRIHGTTKVVIKGDKTPIEEDPKVQAELSAHSEETKVNVYDNRNFTVEKVKNNNIFAKQVAEMMEKDALELDENLKKTDVIELKQLTKLLNLESPCEEIKDLSDLVKTEGLFAEFQHNGRIIIVATPITAALMQSYIKHIDNSIPELKLDSPEKLKRFLCERFYLEECLSRFPANILAKGKQIEKSHTFPLPSLF